MKMTGRRSVWWVVWIAASLVTPAASLGGADDEGHERTKEFLKKIDKTQEAMLDARKELEKTLDHYNKMLGSDTQNRRSRYEDAMKGIEKTEERSEELGKRLREMHKEADRLFNAWRKSLKDIQKGKLRTRSEDRLNEARERHKALHGEGLDARGEIDKVVRSMRDHMLYLGHDLNDSSAASLQEEQSELAEQADRCVERLADYTQRAQDYARSLSPE